MVKLVALYLRPEDPEAFDRHYFQTHLPLAGRMPGLRRAEVARVQGAPGGESPYYLMTELYFDSRESLEAAMRSPEGREAARDLMGFAGRWVSLHIAEVLDVPGAAPTAAGQRG